MGCARLAFWFRFLRITAVGLVLVYVGTIITAGATPAARPILYTLAGLWLAIVVFSARSCLRRPPRLQVEESEGRGDPDSSAKLPWPRARRLLDVAATNLVVTLILAELALQAYVYAGHGSLLVRANLDACRLVPGCDYGAGLYGNSGGYPGPELAPARTPGVTRIAAIGDSFAVGPAVPFADNYLTRLAGELPAVEVGNFGVSGAGPREYLEILNRDVWQVQPDLVLVNVFVGNDITEALPRPRSLDPRRHALYLLAQRGWKLGAARGGNAVNADAGASARLAAPPLPPEVFRQVEARRLAVCLKDPSPSMEKKWRRALADLDGIIQACERRGVALAVVLIPDEFQVNDAVLRDALRDAGVASEDVDLDSPQRQLLAFFAERGVRCLDLLPAFRQTPGTYAPCDTHWNCAGNHLAAQQIAAWLLNTGSN